MLLMVEGLEISQKTRTEDHRKGINKRTAMGYEWYAKNLDYSFLKLDVHYRKCDLWLVNLDGLNQSI